MMAPKKGECHTQWLVTIRILDERDSNTRMSMNDWWLAMIIAGCRKRSLALLICSFLTAVASSKIPLQVICIKRHTKRCLLLLRTGTG